MAAQPKTTPLSELFYQLAVSTPELAKLLGVTDDQIRNNLVDGAGHPVKVGDLPPDGQAWVVFHGALIPARKNVNGWLTFFRCDVHAALETAGERLTKADG